MVDSAHVSGVQHSRRLRLLPREEHEAVAGAKARLETKAGRRLRAQRRGIEGTISQAVRGLKLRRARHRGSAKTTLPSVVTAAAMDLDRLAAWLAGRPLEPNRTSRFAALAAQPVTSPAGSERWADGAGMGTVCCIAPLLAPRASRDLPDMAMPSPDLLRRPWISIMPGLRGWRPVIRRMRITVGDVLGRRASGTSEAEILDDFPGLAFAAERERSTAVAAE